MRSQNRARKKSRLDQYSIPSPSPPTSENASGRPSPSGHGKPERRAAQTSNSSSYPFPYMRSSSQTTIGAAFNSPTSQAGPHADRMLPSGIPTPASVAFSPPGQLPAASYDNPDFPSPNLYELALLLHSEPGIEAFWSSVVKIATTCYKAERVTLAVPSDSTDLENTPWGQKATFNMADDDVMSLSYLGGRARSGTTGGCTSYSEDEGVPIPQSGTEEESERREFSGTDELDSESVDSVIIDGNSEKLFSPVTVTPSFLDSNSQTTGDGHGEWCPMTTGKPPNTQHPIVSEVEKAEDSNKAYRSDETQLKGQIFPTLQPLNYEADALLDEIGVGRVLQRGKTVVLSREYRDVKMHLVDKEKRRKDEMASSSAKSSPAKSTTSEKRAPPPPPSPGPSTTVGLEKIDLPTSPFNMPSQPPTPLFFVGKGTRRRRNHDSQDHLGHNPILQYYSTQQHLHHVQSPGPQRTASYEEYEQPVSSPWSQSPAPSPAPRPDPSENPFFAQQPLIDEDTFNPDFGSPVYRAEDVVSAIGCESSWTVIHIPLVHPSLSKGFAPTLSSCKPNPDEDQGVQKSHAPIAILSMLSPVIPYPNNLVHSLSNFAPLVATAFSLAQTHTNVLNQLNHFRAERSRRPRPSQRMSSYFNLPDSPVASATSPSEKSIFTSSAVASPGWNGTPGGIQLSHYDAAEHGQDRMPLSPGNTDPPEGHFFMRGRSHIFSRQHSGNVTTVNMLPKGADPEQYTSLEARLHMPTDRKKLDTVQEKKADRGRSVGSYFPTSTRKQAKKPAQQQESATAEGSSYEDEDEDDGLPTGPPDKAQKRTRKRAIRRRRGGARMGHPHTLLHSYGADYGATFQSLSAATSSARLDSTGSTVLPIHDMPPPSNKLLRTIIDSIPVHVFTAIPDTGQISWANARMLAYRGLTSEQFMRHPWDAIHPEDRDEYLRRWGVAIRRGEPFSHQMRVRRFDGQFRWFMVRAVPLRDQRGVIVHWFGTNMDIHDQRLAEVNAARQAEMAESESKYKSLANSSPQIVFAATANDGITFANTQWMSYSGQTFKQALQLGFMDYVHQSDRHKCCLPGVDIAFGGAGRSHRSSPTIPQGAFTKAGGKFKTATTPDPESEDEEKPTFSTELRLKDKHGNFRWHLVRCVSVDSNLEDGESLWFGTCTDINDHKLLEEKLKEANETAQKTMESKTRFLANMSHEISLFLCLGSEGIC